MDDERREELRRVLRHDVRTPLAVILGRCELLSAGLQGPITPAQASALEAIARNATKVTRLLDEALELLQRP